MNPNKPNDPNQNLPNYYVLSQNIAPGAINQQHLLPSPVAKGDIYYGRDGVHFARLPIGTTGQVLTVAGGIPTYATPATVIGIAGSGVVVCTVNTTINGAATDITGATVTFTPTVASYMLVTASFDIAANTAGDVYLGSLVVDGVAQSALATFDAASNSDRKTVMQTWRVSLTVASHTIKLQGTRNSGSGSATYNADHTRFTYLLFSQ